LEHRRKVAFNLLVSAAGKEENLLRVLRGWYRVFCRSTELPDFIGGGVAYVVNGVVVLLFIEGHFKREDGEQFVHAVLDGLDTVLLPCPYLRGNIVEHLG
jgi:hypothetical protein